MTGQQSIGEAATGSERRVERQDQSGAGGMRHDRQVLVVGDTTTALVTAGFLEQAGLDPVLAQLPDEQTNPDALALWQPGLVLLGRLGLRRPVEGLGTRLDRLRCPSTGSSWTTESMDRPPLLTVRRPELKDLLDRRIGDRVRTANRPLADLERRTSRIDATFEDGITEPFDTVVTTDPAFPALESDQGAATLHAWTFDWPAATATPDIPTERWDDDRAAFSVPVGDGTHVRLVAATDPTEAATDLDALERRFGTLFDPSVNPFGGLSQHAVRYHRSPRIVPRSVHADGVVLVGPGTRASLPGDCLRTTLGIEDAWVLADALAYGPQDRDDALDAYERRRRRRDRDIQQYAMADAPAARVPGHISPSLSRLCASRTLAFGHVTSGHPPDVAATIPESL